MFAFLDLLYYVFYSLKYLTKQFLLLGRSSELIQYVVIFLVEFMKNILFGKRFIAKNRTLCHFFAISSVI